MNPLARPSALADVAISSSKNFTRFQVTLQISANAKSRVYNVLYFLTAASILSEEGSLKNRAAIAGVENNVSGRFSGLP